MALISYVEPISIGEIFIGFAFFIFTLVFAWLMVRIFTPAINLLKIVYNRETRYQLIEDKLLTDYAMEKGIDLEKEMIKKEVIHKRRPSFRKKIEDEIFDNMFPEEANKEK